MTAAFPPPAVPVTAGASYWLMVFNNTFTTGDSIQIGADPGSPATDYCAGSAFSWPTTVTCPTGTGEQRVLIPITP